MDNVVFTVVVDTKKLDSIAKSLNTNADRLLARLAFRVEALTKVHALRDPARPPLDPSVPTTGALRNSIFTEKIGDLLYMVGVGVEYAKYHEPKEYASYGVFREFGSSRLPARPFLSPSIERMRKEAEGMWGELFE